MARVVLKQNRIQQMRGVNIIAPIMQHRRLALVKQRAHHAAAHRCQAQRAVFAAKTAEQIIVRKAAASQEKHAAKHRIAAHRHLHAVPCPRKIRLLAIFFRQPHRVQAQAHQSQKIKLFKGNAGSG